MRTITIQVEGVAVRGRVLERSAGSVEVLLEEPYGHLHLTNGSNIMAAARRYLNFEGGRGDEVLHRLLSELFMLARHIEDHRADLEVQWAAVRRQLDDRRPSVVKSRNELKAGVASLREQLRNGVISGPQCQQTIRTLRDDFDEWLFSAEEAALALWQERGFDLNLELLQQAIQSLDPTFSFGDGDPVDGGDE